MTLHVSEAILTITEVILNVFEAMLNVVKASINVKMDYGVLNVLNKIDNVTEAILF